ncbi:hypothetical protein K469DRAFT_753631 [Zopfia rhizophila CBS 207.26]|uniref:HNH nuclease domain-containing protein n=1 Tax=Zopfia rhizophila CBS 207.26 TaxID=1314779 RepID=A0A6A6DQJ5_9PEZI|nr:hypothetical protein K469DRAFT_753631 [Zopfia rhizophila CBS 207.26]
MAASHLHWLDIAKQHTTRNKFLECLARYVPEISPRVWAFAMVAPVDKLAMYNDSINGPMAPFFKHLDADIKTALDVWQQRGTKDEPADEDNNQPARKKRKTTSEATSQPRDTRDQSLVTHCMERDNKVCVLLWTKAPDVAHIIPFSLQSTLKQSETKKRDNRDWFWRVIDLMYTQEEVQEIKRAAGVMGDPNGGLVQRLDNLLCLNNFTHRRLTMGDFAFEPIPRNPGDENRKQSMIFHWLPTITHSGTITAGTHPEHKEGLADSSDVAFLSERLYRADGERIYSGQRIDMTTNDPAHLPLPSYELLRLQWDVQRLLHLSGGAEALELSDDDEDDDDGYDLLIPDSDDENELIRARKGKRTARQQSSDESYDSGLGMVSMELTLNPKATTRRCTPQEDVEKSQEVI